MGRPGPGRLRVVLARALGSPMPPADLASSIYVRAAGGKMYGSKYGRITDKLARSSERLVLLKGEV